MPGNVLPLHINKNSNFESHLQCCEIVFLKSNICFRKICSKLTSVLILCLLQLFMKQTLVNFESPQDFFYESRAVSRIMKYEEGFGENESAEENMDVT